MWIVRIVRYRFVKYRFVRYTFGFVKSPVNILFLSIVSSRRLQDMSSRRLQEVFQTCLQEVFSVTIFRHRRRLQDVLEDVKLLRWRRVEDVFMPWRPLQDVFKTNKCLLGYFWIDWMNSSNHLSPLTYTILMVTCHLFMICLCIIFFTPILIF